MSTIAKFTAGPWIHDQPENMIVVEMEDGTQRLIAQARSLHFSKEVRDANSRLIAASPTLLMALEFLLEQAEGFNVSGVYFNEFRENRDAIDTANNAIALATGAT